MLTNVFGIQAVITTIKLEPYVDFKRLAIANMVLASSAVMLPVSGSMQKLTSACVCV